MTKWLLAFKQVLLHPFQMMESIFDNDAHRIVSKRGLELLNQNSNMTPKEKAIDLILKYNVIVLDTALGGSNTRVKQCALIAVDEILNTIEYSSQADELSKLSYWDKVKQEINKL